MKKQFLFIALCVSAAALLLTGCPTNGDDDDGNGETVTITRVEDLADGLKGLPFNDAGSPCTVVLKGLDIRADWGAINDAVREAEQYVTLDLSSCSVGREITGSQQSPAGSDFNIIWDNEYIRAVILPNTLQSIGDYAFYRCGYLTSITIPASVTYIGDYAFYRCGYLRSVTIPASVTSIGMEAFSGCTNLSAITVDTANTAYLSHDGVLYDKPATRIVAVPRKLAGAVTIPNGITSIGMEAFSDCTGLTSVTIPGSVTSIGDWAFFNCTSLTSVTIPASVASIGDCAFSYCRGLTSVTIPGSVTSIGQGAFSWCTGLTSITIPGSVTSIGQEAFSWCTGLTSLTIPVGLVPAGGSSIFPSGFETIVSGYESLAVVLTGNGGVGFLAFYNCAGLTSVTIGNSVTSIGDYAFYGCTGLTSVTFEGSGTVVLYGRTFPYDDSSPSLLEAGGATYENGNKMAAGTYTWENEWVGWMKQP